MLKNKSEDEYKAVARLPETMSSSRKTRLVVKATGYVPVTNAAYDLMKSENYFEAKPTARSHPAAHSRHATDNSRGFASATTPDLSGDGRGTAGRVDGAGDAQEALDRAATRGTKSPPVREAE